MICELAFYLIGGVGMQSGYKFDGYTPTAPKTNDYNLMLGEIELTMECGWFYKAVKHISGLNTGEEDLGLNALMSGVTRSYGPFTGKLGYGIQSTIGDQPSNSYGTYLAEASVMIEGWGILEGFYAKAMKLDDMNSFNVGLMKRW